MVISGMTVQALATLNQSINIPNVSQQYHLNSRVSATPQTIYIGIRLLVKKYPRKYLSNRSFD